MAKTNQKCVRLSDKVARYIEGYRGENFSQKLENYVLDTEERRELEKIRTKVRRAGDVDLRFSQLVSSLLEFMDA